ncbi:uncharacterized protein LOC127396144 [Apus apus]|uniref:uncharacterized protein LOC127396144 n=1 Tax=Apus apus TaxID=8895 RepID=UPI0021F8C137|nr:uncharacterized protein LOC127396144 [Apus apus]
MGLAQLGERLLRPHLGPTESMGLSPTGDLLATGGRDHAVALWGNHGAAMGQLRWRQNEAHRDWVCALGWTGRLLISGSLDGTVGLWDPDVGQKLQELEGLEGPPRAVGGHGRAVLAVSASGSVAAWEGAELRSLVTLRGPAQGALPPPGRGRAMAAVTDPEGHTHLWEPLQPPRPRPLGSAGPGALGVIVGEGPGLAPPPGAGPAPQSPAPNHVIVTATRGGAIRMTPLPPPDEPLPLPWDPRSRFEEELVGGCGRVTSLAWSPCGSHVIVGGAKGSLSLWGEGRLLSQAKVSPLPISALGFVAPHELLVASGRQVELWAVGQEQDAYRLRPVSPLAELGVPVLWMVRALAPPPGPPALLLLGDGQVWGYRGGEGLRPLRVLPEEPLPHPLPHLLHQPPDTWVPPDPSVTSPEAWVPPSPYRLPAPPLEPQPLPDGSILVWGGASDPQLRRLVPMEGGLWRSLAPALPPSPLPTHGPTRWFSGARLVPGVGLFLARSDGTLWVCTGRGDPWVRRRVSGSPLTSLQLLGPGLVTTSQEGLARLWDPRGGPPEAHYRCAGPITCCAVHPGSAPGSAPHLALGDAWGHTYMLRWDTPTAACHAHSK